MTSFAYMVRVEAERESGVFGSRDDLGEQIQEALEQADPGDLYVEGASGGEGNYCVAGWDVVEHFDPKLPTQRQRDKALAALRAGDADHKAMAAWIEQNVGARR